ncbi:hypothetical protein I79_025992 [Cricetulus griseus]|uniref:Uncharacterized protein n=1 Tax=Cricetulus griseus TaxID=10029 RepID=G3IPR8_CRIGR|nr:hypothetical protein I79_025992 [Cricetulus griseus]
MEQRVGLESLASVPLMRKPGACPLFHPFQNLLKYRLHLGTEGGAQLCTQALRKHQQEHCKFEANWHCILRPCLQRNLSLSGTYTIDFSHRVALAGLELSV